MGEMGEGGREGEGVGKRGLWREGERAGPATKTSRAGLGVGGSCS